MNKFVDSKNPGKLTMSNKVKFGKPRAMVSSKSGSTDKQDKRGENTVIFR